MSESNLVNKMTPCKPEDFTVGQKVRLSEEGKEMVSRHGSGCVVSWSTGVVTSTNCKSRITVERCIRVRPDGNKGTQSFASCFWEPDGR